jgi:hypothetical protein
MEAQMTTFPLICGDVQDYYSNGSKHEETVKVTVTDACENTLGPSVALVDKDGKIVQGSTKILPKKGGIRTVDVPKDHSIRVVCTGETGGDGCKVEFENVVTK